MTWFKRKKMTELEQLIRYHTDIHGISFATVAAIVWQESRGDPLAHRYEDEFYKRYVEAKDRAELIGHVPHGIPTLATEKRDRAYSWGLMQIMGQTARETGFTEDNLTALLDPSLNLDIGCKFLAKLHKKHKTLYGVLAAYNGSSAYAEAVQIAIKEGTYLKLFT